MNRSGTGAPTKSPTSPAGKWAAGRDAFDIPESIAYLNTANMGPRLHAVTAAAQSAVTTTAAPWTIPAADWFSGAERLRALFAALVQGDADGVALVPSVSYGIATAAANLPLAPGQEILLLHGQFPSNVYAWRRVARRQQAVIRTVRCEPGTTWTESVLAGIGSRTAVVAVPQCRWTDGALLDLPRIGRAARVAGAALVVDASQSLGACPLDVGEVQPDFLVTVGYKWLLGPYGLGYLYVGPHRRSGEPLEESWLVRAGSEDFSRLDDYRDGYRRGARRFDMGEFPQFMLTPMATAALEQILAWGVRDIQETLSFITGEIVARAVRHGFEPACTERAGHMLGLILPDGIRHQTAAALAAAGVHASIRGNCLRVSPHLHTSAGDVDRLEEVLAR